MVAVTGMPSVDAVFVHLGKHGADAWISYRYHDWEAVLEGVVALDEFTSQAKTAWITATVPAGHGPGNFAGDNLTAASNAGHTVICRVNSDTPRYRSDRPCSESSAVGSRLRATR